jgi:8-oxo-dGTP pyrophosphatase MutT (NUDIX family)
MFDNKLDNLKKRLLLPLPGKEAQNKLAPSYRPSLEENEPRLLAGVTILLYSKGEDLYFPLIVRPEYDGAHSGQISFPGGKKEEEDRNVIITALRECEEEIGIDASKMIVLGSLTHLFIPVSRFDVYPIIAYYNSTPTFVPQENEVVSIIEVPVKLILDDNCIVEKKVDFKGNEETVPFFSIYNHVVWGATAMILGEFVQVWKESTAAYSDTRFL